MLLYLSLIPLICLLAVGVFLFVGWIVTMCKAAARQTPTPEESDDSSML